MFYQTPQLSKIQQQTQVSYYTPAQIPPAGAALEPETAPKLFQPVTFRGMTLQNRIMVRSHPNEHL